MTCRCGQPATVTIVLTHCIVDGCQYCTRTVCYPCALRHTDPLHT